MFHRHFSDLKEADDVIRANHNKKSKNQPFTNQKFLDQLHKYEYRNIQKIDELNKHTKRQPHNYVTIAQRTNIQYPY